MMRVYVSFLNSPFFFRTLSALSRGYYSNTAKTTDGKFHDMKWDENLSEKAQTLIFGEKKYSDFSLEDQKIVDYYQKKNLEIDGGVILPNTRADLEQMEIQQLLAEGESG